MSLQYCVHQAILFLHENMSDKYPQILILYDQQLKMTFFNQLVAAPHDSFPDIFSSISVCQSYIILDQMSQ